MAIPAGYYRFEIEIVPNESDTYSYYVVQEFQEDGRDHEVLAYGDDVTFEEASQSVQFAIKEVL